MESTGTIGILSREITLVSLNGEESKFYLHVLKPLEYRNKSDLIKLKNHKLSSLEISTFEIFPFKREEPFIIYFDCPLKLTQINEQSYQLTFLPFLKVN